MPEQQPKLSAGKTQAYVTIAKRVFPTPTRYEATEKLLDFSYNHKAHDSTSYGFINPPLYVGTSPAAEASAAITGLEKFMRVLIKSS